jgi:hypothetical protein
MGRAMKSASLRLRFSRFLGYQSPMLLPKRAGLLDQGDNPDYAKLALANENAAAAVAARLV